MTAGRPQSRAPPRRRQRFLPPEAIQLQPNCNSRGFARPSALLRGSCARREGDAVSRGRRRARAGPCIAQCTGSVAARAVSAAAALGLTLSLNASKELQAIPIG